MTHCSIAVDSALREYLTHIGVTEHPVMQQLREFTATHRLAKMQIAPEQGQLLGWLTRLTGARRYLEIGVFTGYSTLAVALAMPQASEVVACDVSKIFSHIAQQYWAKAGVAHRIRLVLQPAMATLKELLAELGSNYFDMIFIDADKASTPDYYEACLPLVRAGGIIAIDNVLLAGRVIDPQPDDPPSVAIMHQFNASLKSDSRVNLCVLPIGDGMTLLRRL